jgi:hypothetical protein
MWWDEGTRTWFSQVWPSPWSLRGVISPQ